MSSPTPPSRRELREAARRARDAAEAAGRTTPPSRRELRRRQLEEQARLDAVATGELPVFPEDAADGAAPTVATSTPGSAASVASAVSARSVPSALTSGSAASAVSAPSTAASASEAGGVSRRSLRERADSASRPADPPGPRTATRPVVRVPQSARAVRGLDATGALAPVRPVPPARSGEDHAGTGDAGPATPAVPAGMPRPGSTPADASSDPAAWESAAAAGPARAEPATPAEEPAGPAVDAPVPSAVSPAWAAGAVELRPSRRRATAREETGAADERQRSGPGSRGSGPSPDRPAPQQGPLAVAAAAMDAQDRAGPPDGDADEARDGAGSPGEPDSDRTVRWTALGQFSGATSSSAEEADGGGGPVTAGASRRREIRGRDRDGEPVRRSVRDRMSATGGVAEATVSPAHPTSEELPAVEEEIAPVADARSQNPSAPLVRIIVLVLAAVVIGLLIGMLAFRGEDSSGADLRMQGRAVPVQAPTGT